MRICPQESGLLLVYVWRSQDAPQVSYQTEADKKRKRRESEVVEGKRKRCEWSVSHDGVEVY